jgi:hypothetical protein
MSDVLPPTSLPPSTSGSSLTSTVLAADMQHSDAPVKLSKSQKNKARKKRKKAADAVAVGTEAANGAANGVGCGYRWHPKIMALLFAELDEYIANRQQNDSKSNARNKEINTRIVELIGVMTNFQKDLLDKTISRPRALISMFPLVSTDRVQTRRGT